MINNTIYTFMMRNQSEVIKKAYRPTFLFCVAVFLILLISASDIQSVPVQGSNEDVQNYGPATGDDIKRGERLFRGLISAGPDALSCASCHNVNPIDTFNWNPSAYEISLLYRSKSPEDLGAVVMEPSSMRMIEVHNAYQLSGEELFMIKSWMDDFAGRGMAERPVITNVLLFILLLIIFLAAVADLVIFKKISFKLIHLAVILGAGLFMLKTVSHEAIALGRSKYYEPDQPIKFSHRVHAHDNKTDCLYCHSVAEYAHPAGIPSVSQCMNCHLIVREGTYSGRFEINKLVDAWENEMPVRWIKIHNLPDHAFFSHAQHVGAAGLDCFECHGEVEMMDRVMQVNDLSMGWCLDCHRKTEVDILNNEFYSVYMKLRDDVRAGRIDFATARETGGTDCMKCHY